jgi:hypothetical protein
VEVREMDRQLVAGDIVAVEEVQDGQLIGDIAGVVLATEEEPGGRLRVVLELGRWTRTLWWDGYHFETLSGKRENVRLSEVAA